MGILDVLKSFPETLPHNPRKQYLIDHSGMVSKVLVGIFTAVATVAAITRLAIHIKHRRKLFVDDYLVLFATACLAVQTAMLYKFSEVLYVLSLLSTDVTSYALFTRSELAGLWDGLKWSNIFISFAWTVNYTIKLSFLAFFWTLVRDLSKRLTRYWWFVLVFVVLSWVFSAIENIIFCGAKYSDKCSPVPRFVVPRIIVTSTVDILSDLMIISIPIIILNKSQMRLSQKLRILAFLCLNVFMATFCLIRIAGSYRNPHGTIQIHIEWTFLTMHMESSVAVLMGGVTAFRNIFASRIRERQHRDQEQMSPKFDIPLRRLFNRGSPLESLKEPQNGKEKSILSRIRVGGTLSGLRTFIRNYEQEPGQTTVSDDSHWDDSALESPYSYHAFKRSEKQEMEVHTKCSLECTDEETILSLLPERPMPTLQTHNIV